MKMMLLGLAASIAAFAIPASPALADGSRGPFVGRPTASPVHFPGSTIDTRRCRHRDRCRVDAGFVSDFYGGEWALYNNRSWESDSYNDWWHDQPWRAYPHWMTHNQNCERRWFAGDTLRC
jgi:hypothetical protein